MKVFVTGATGYIGFNVALAMRHVGHEVWGLARSPQGAARLVRHEIHAVKGCMEQPESYAKVAEACSVLIHTAADPNDRERLDKLTVQTLLEAAHRGPRPKTLVYTSGVWVYGDTGHELVDETSPLTPPKLVAFRPAVEEMVRGAAHAKGLVIRPGCVYGKAGSLTGLWFGGAYTEKSLKVVGDGRNHWAMIHIDDVAIGYRLVAESGLGGEVFNLTDNSRDTVGLMAAAAARAAGDDGKIQFVPLGEARHTLADFAECLALDQHADSGKAARLLGFRVKHHSFLAEVETFFQAWKAWRDLK